MMLKKDRGAVLVEIALGFPVFIAMFLFTLWYGYMKLSQRTLISAVENGVFAARTRGNPELSGREDGLIPMIDRFKSAGGSSFSNDLKRLYVSANPTSPISTNPLQTYDAAIGSTFAGGAKLQNMHTEYLYALFYTLETMRTGLGEHLVKFPCDPQAEAGCLMCKPLNGPAMGCNNPNGSWNKTINGCSCLKADSADPEEVHPPADCRRRDIPATRFGIHCVYSPAGNFMAMALSILGGTPGKKPTVHHSLWYNLAVDD